ncbi:MAG: hypothetical protein J7K04_16945 [Spirochaetales bacterium]|nr:hypothetical protein [Spirochaetales bacterium]
MKKSLILIPLILFIFIIVVIVLASLNILFFWGINYSSVSAANGSPTLKNLAYRIFQVLAVSVFTTIVLISFRVLKKPPSRFLSFLIILTTSYCILVLSVVGVLETGGKSKPKQNLTYKLVPERINSFKRHTVFPVRTNNGKDTNFVILDLNEEKGSQLSYIRNGEVNWDNGYLVIRDRNKVIRAEEKSALPIVAEIFKKNAFVNLFLRDLSYFNNDILRLYNVSLKAFLILMLSVIFFFTVCGIFMRITQWPLFNIFLSFAVMRGFFSFYRWLELRVLPQTVSIFTVHDFSYFFPSIVIGAVGLLFFLIDILFVPFNYWEKEITG